MKPILVTGFGLVFLIAFNVANADSSGSAKTPKASLDKPATGMGGISGTAPSTNAADQVVSVNGIVSISRQGNEITRFYIGNVDDNMKTGYDIVLDKKGKELAESKTMRGIIHVKGRVVVKNGKKMLALDEFIKQ